MSKLRVVKTSCDECPFEGRFALQPARLKSIVDACHERGKEKTFDCHKTIKRLGGKGPVAVCGGFHKRYPNCSAVQQIAARLKLIEYVDVK